MKAEKILGDLDGLTGERLSLADFQSNERVEVNSTTWKRLALVVALFKSHIISALGQKRHWGKTVITIDWQAGQIETVSDQGSGRTYR